MFGTNSICNQRPKAGYETQGLHSNFDHVDLDNKIMNRKRPILRVRSTFHCLSRIAFIGYKNYVKDAQAFYWLNSLRKSLAQI
jgi:hypothetical protein